MEHYVQKIPFQETIILSEKSILKMEEKLETIRVVAMEMAADIVMCYSERTPRDARCKYTSVMRRMVEKLLHQYGTTFNQLVSSLDLNEENVCLSFKNVADEVIRGDINWGRIVTLYAMAAQFAMFATTSGQGHILCRLVETCSGYICDRLLTWINTHGGWDGFVERYKDGADTEKQVWWGLLFTAMGLGALALFIGK